MLKQYHNNATQGDGLFKKLPKLLIIKRLQLCILYCLSFELFQIQVATTIFFFLSSLQKKMKMDIEDDDDEDDDEDDE